MGDPAGLCRRLLLGGMLLRAGVFVFQGGYNDDLHILVLKYWDLHGRLPTTGQYDQGYHPPLYYLLAAIPYFLTHNPKIVQALSLAFSIGTLWVLDRILSREAVCPARCRPWCLALALEASRVPPRIRPLSLTVIACDSAPGR